jgi:hypothetical protein
MRLTPDSFCPLVRIIWVVKNFGSLRREEAVAAASLAILAYRTMATAAIKS